MDNSGYLMNSRNKGLVSSERVETQSLGGKVAQDGIILTEYQLKELEGQKSR